MVRRLGKILYLSRPLVRARARAMRRRNMFEGLYRLGTFYTLARARNLYRLEPFLSASGPCLFQKDEVRGYGELAVGYRQFNSSLSSVAYGKLCGLLPFILHYLDML